MTELVRRRSIVMILLMLVIAAVSGAGPVRASTLPAPAAVAAAAPGAFSLAVIPDTQQEVFGADTRFANRTQWLVDNRAALNLAFVLHTGDVVNWDTADHAQYAIARTAMQKLTSAGIPWIPAIGNHDTAAVCAGGSACPGQSAHVNVRGTATFNQYFPVSSFPAVNGTFESGKVDNAWSTFTAGNMDWLVLNLELWPRAQVISWARDVVAGHPQHNVIVVTHSYLNAGGGIEQGNGGYGDTSPQYLYDNLVRPFSNVKLVFSGHVGNAASRTDVRPDGSKVVSFLGAFHSNSTNPVQIVTIDPAAGSVSTRFYAPKDGATWPQYATTVTGVSWGPPQPSGSWVALRAVANDRFVTAEAAGAQPLIANRTVAQGWERFILHSLGGNEVNLWSLASQRYVTAEAAGAQPLIANRAEALGWEQFELIDNGDGTVSFRARANNLLVTAEAAGAQSLVANRTAIGGWEKFVLVRL
ncbi:MAG: metallophosphoesterase [Nakamurella multipartita]